MFFKVNTFFLIRRNFFINSVIFFLFLGIGIPFALNGQDLKKDSKKTVYFGKASYYDEYFNGKHTANGEIFSHKLLTAAHPSWPFNTKVRVTNLTNSNSVVVRINDRGPFIPGRHIDVSKQAAKILGFEKSGVVKVKMEVLVWGDRTDSSSTLMANVSPPKTTNRSPEKGKASNKRTTVTSDTLSRTARKNMGESTSSKSKSVAAKPAKQKKTELVSMAKSVVTSDTNVLEQVKATATVAVAKPTTKAKPKVTEKKTTANIPADKNEILCSNSDSLSGWCVQVGSYGNRMNAQRTLDKVKGTTQEWACIQVIYRNDLPFYRVICGKNIENTKAVEIKHKLSGTYPDAFVTNYTVLLNNSTISK